MWRIDSSCTTETRLALWPIHIWCREKFFQPRSFYPLFRLQGLLLASKRKIPERNSQLRRCQNPKTHKEKSTFLTGINFALTSPFWTLCLNRNISVSKGNRNMVIQHMSVANDLADPNLEAYFRKLIRF